VSLNSSIRHAPPRTMTPSKLTCAIPSRSSPHLPTCSSALTISSGIWLTTTACGTERRSRISLSLARPCTTGSVSFTSTATSSELRKSALLPCAGWARLCLGPDSASRDGPLMVRPYFWSTDPDNSLRISGIPNGGEFEP
jgi:hypothetical protein